MNFTINQRLHGFTVKGITPVYEIGGKIIMMEHEGSGCQLCFIDRPDNNKTFAIAFRTIPEDDTGVFHILEHSVLCGSDKFPTKEPFTELLKCSLNTFLNALTYSDLTAYPLSSRNEKDFLNMMEVYLDAVFHPIAKRDARIFAQEGHRYELDENGELKINGVVYNEMKGAYSSPEELTSYLCGQRLYPGTAYAYDSGGNPEAIPSLTYEKFVAMHDKYYHPSEGFVFLDGEVNLDTALPLIDSYLCEFDRRPPTADVGTPAEIDTVPYVGSYEIEEGDEEKDKNRVSLSYRAARFDEREKKFALSIIADTISDGNTAPLKAAMLSHGIMDNFIFYPSTSNKYCAFNVTMKGVKDGHEEEAVELFHKEIEKIIDTGIPEDQLLAAIGASEFRAREADFDSYPKGIIYLMSIFDTLPYGGNPADSLRYNDLYSFMRSKVGTPYFTDLLREVFVGTPEVKIILHPSKTLAKEKEARLNAQLKAKLDSMTEEQREELKRTCEDFVNWQNTPDSEQALATIPRLTLADLDPKIKETPSEITTHDGVQVIMHPICTGGISYAELLFDCSDLTVDEIFAMRLLSSTVDELNSEHRTARDRASDVKMHLGDLLLSLKPVKRGENAHLYATVTISCLDSELDAAKSLVEEYLYKVNYCSPEAFTRRLSQLRPVLEEYITGSGSSVALTRTAARYEDVEYLKELIAGYEHYLMVKAAEAEAENAVPKYIGILEELRKRIFVKNRLTLGITTEKCTEAAQALISAVRDGGEACTSSFRGRLPKRSEGIATPSAVSFAVRGTNLYLDEDGEYTGAFSTLTGVLNYAILWPAVRVSGGAYGTGFICRANSGTVAAYSYRDPNPKGSISVFKTMGERVREFLSESPSLDNFIIGEVGSSEPITTPRQEGSSATSLVLAEKSHEELEKARIELMNTTPEKLFELSALLDRLDTHATTTVVGPREVLLSLGLDEILSL